MKGEKLKKAKTREEKGRMIEERRVLNGQFKPIPKEDAEKIVKAMVDTFPELDLQTPPDKIKKAPESAMQSPPPKFASPLDRQWKSPNGDPFYNLYQKQQKSK